MLRRKRKILGIACLTCTALWVLSIWVGITLNLLLFMVVSDGGIISICWPTDDELALSEMSMPVVRMREPGVSARGSKRFTLGLLLPGTMTLWGMRFVYLPLWLPTLASGLAWLVLRRLTRPKRKKEGHCDHCGYDLRGNVSGRCSECGTSLPAPNESHTAA